MCLQCEARSLTYDRSCAGCVSRDIERMPERFRKPAFLALPPDLRERVKAVRVAQAAALDAAAAEVLSPAHREFLTTQQVDRSGNRWKAYARLQRAFREQFPDATEQQKQIAGHRLAEFLGV